MKPQESHSDDRHGALFKTELSDIIDRSHPLAKLAHTVDWTSLDQAFAPLFCGDNGCPAKSTRLMTALQYLKYTYDLSDEDVVDG